MDRLFVPMCRRQFLLFQSGSKTFEVRQRGRQWTRQFVTQGRQVEIRLGYSKSYKPLWGTVGLVYEASSINELFDKVPFDKVMPVAGNLETAKMFARHEFFFGDQCHIEGLEAFNSTKIDLIAFEVIMNKVNP